MGRARARAPRAASRSDVQQSLEALVLERLGRRWKAALSGHRLDLAAGVAVKLDGYARDGRAVMAVEVTAQLGAPKAAQQQKVLADALKLALVRSVLEAEGLQVRTAIAFIDPEASRWLSGKSWGALACRTFGVELEQVDVGDESRARVEAAKRRQDLTARATSAPSRAASPRPRGRRRRTSRSRAARPRAASPRAAPAPAAPSPPAR